MADDSNLLLGPLEAAHLLGITQELLFAYVRNAPKGADGRRLATSQHRGQTYFRRSELLNFDDYLKELIGMGGEASRVVALVHVLEDDADSP